MTANGTITRDVPACNARTASRTARQAAASIPGVQSVSVDLERCVVAVEADSDAEWPVRQAAASSLLVVLSALRLRRFELLAAPVDGHASPRARQPERIAPVA